MEVNKAEMAKKNVDQEMLEKVMNARLPEEEQNMTWSEFAENSTFHGIKYIFKGGFLIRRYSNNWYF